MLSVSQLAFGYLKFPIFQDLTFTVGAGELVHVRGPNGAGKSTLLGVIAGLLQPDAGSVEWDDRTVKEYLPAEGNGHYTKMGAAANLKFWLRLHNRSLSTDELLTEVDFWRLSRLIVTQDLAIEKYSTGMKRKLALARLRLTGANFWLLDEPVTGLDDFALDRFEEMLKRHLDQGGSALVVSHDTKPIASLTTQTIHIGG